jgi:predicted neutral ceramidase superfamily lipid hydrolase
MRVNKDFLIIFFSQFFIYFLVILNTRAYTKDNYVLTGVSDLLFASLQFFVIKKISKDESNKSFLPYVLGGLVGSLTSMYISKYAFNI